MNERDILYGIWYYIDSQEQFDSVAKYGVLQLVGDIDNYVASRIQKGTYSDPGMYYLLSYSQKCPRGCCYDSVNELIDKYTAISELERLKHKAIMLIEKGE